jgi:hypothetical protein
VRNIKEAPEPWTPDRSGGYHLGTGLQGTLSWRPWWLAVAGIFTAERAIAWL